MHVQIPTDVHALVQLLARLGFICGPMKSARMKDGQINIWFISARGAADVKRASARFVRGLKKVHDGCPRRVYLDLRIQDYSNVWRDITDQEFLAAGLELPHRYYGACYIGIEYDVPRGEASWLDDPSHGQETVAYFSLLPGSRENAIAEAERRIEAFYDEIRTFSE